MAAGLDVGTFNLVCARRGEKNEFKYRQVINAFIELPLTERYLFNMMKRSKEKPPIIERDNIAYVLGEHAVKMSYSLNNKVELKRPMKDGCLNPQEKDAFAILMLMIHSLIGKAEKDNEIVYYSVPANAINKETDAAYHQKVLESMLKKYKVDDKNITPYPINEGLALIYSELEDKNFTGIGLSAGAGMSNFCYSIYAAEVSSFSIVNSGDWIDSQAAKACGETSSFINKEKTKIDLSKNPSGMVERAIMTQYRLMVENTFSNIKRAIAEKGNLRHPEDKIDIIIGGGTASPPGFIELVKEIVKGIDLPIPIGEISLANDHLHAVARGALIAAEMSQI